MIREAVTPAPEFKANPDLINKQAARIAYAGTSFEPEKRGEQAISGFAQEVQDVYGRLKSHARTDAQKALLLSEMEKFQASYAQKYNDLLYSHSRIYSTMIAGPSGFPAERMRKINEAYDKKARETYEWKDRAEKAMLRALKELATEEAGGELEVLKKKIADAERNHEFMVQTNVIVRKKISDDQKVREIMAIGPISEKTAREILEPDFMGRVGFPAYALSNDTANIRRMKERLKELEKKEVTPTGEIPFTGGYIVDNREADRVQIFFDQRPSQEMITKLKSEGWRWSPSIGAWQRKRTDAAMYSARRITGAAQPPAPAVQPPAPQPKEVPKYTPTNDIISLAKFRASEWFKAQVNNPFERYYLYHRIGDFRISNIDLPGYTLSHTERISPAWTVEQATQWIINTAQRLPILPLDAFPAAAPAVQPQAALPVPAPRLYAVPELRWVYGTQDLKWHLVGPEDRDYAQGITQERMKIIGPELAKAEYLGPSLIAPQSPAVPRIGELDKIVAIIEKYLRDKMSYEDFVAGLKGFYLMQSGYQINHHLDSERLLADLKKAGYKNLYELWDSTARKLGVVVKLERSPELIPAVPEHAIEEIMVIPDPEKMTKAEYIKERYKRMAEALRMQGKEVIADRIEKGSTSMEWDWKFVESHKSQIELAIEQGKTVSYEVLKDYPDIVAKIRKENVALIAKEREERERLLAKERTEENELLVELNKLPPPLKRHAETEIYGTLHLPETHKDYHNRYNIAIGIVRRIAYTHLPGGKELQPQLKAEPWEMTQEEYWRAGAGGKAFEGRGTSDYNHKQAVYKAISEGKPVPARVLKDYPDLMKKEVPAVPPPKIQTIQDVKQQVIQSIRSAGSMDELKQILRGLGFLPLPESEKRQLIDLYQIRSSELMGELKFGERITEEEKRKKRKAPQKVAYTPPSRRLEEFGIKEAMRRGYGYA